jgi:VWFA-related protein
MRKFSLLLLVFMLIMLVSSSSAQQATSIEINSVNDDNFPQLELLVNVLDSIGAPVLNLAAEDFIVLLDNDFGQVLSVENITDNNLSIAVVLVIDTSESMIGTPLDDTKAAALAFVDRLAEGDEIAILDFDSDIVIAQDFTTNHDAARDAINGLEAGGRTALYDANFSAAELANTTESPRRFVIFLTDGNEFGGLSTHLPEEGTQLAADNNIALYTIGLG